MKNTISIIVAVSTNNVIGAQGALPWKISDDLKRFRQITMGKPVVMGRLTWESIGRPLPGRQNIVVTNQPRYRADGCVVVQSPAQALRAAGKVDEIVVIGGAQIYDLFLPKAERLYLTRVHATIDGDAFFPGVDTSLWRRVSCEHRGADEVNQFSFDFNVFERIRAS